MDEYQNPLHLQLDHLKSGRVADEVVEWWIDFDITLLLTSRSRFEKFDIVLKTFRKISILIRTFGIL